MVGAVLQAAVFSLGQMTVGRFTIGLGVGSAAMIILLSNVTRSFLNRSSSLIILARLQLPYYNPLS